MLFSNFSIGSGKRRRQNGLAGDDDHDAADAELGSDDQALVREMSGFGARRTSDEDAWNEDAAADGTPADRASTREPDDAGARPDAVASNEEAQDETPLEEVAGGRDRLKALADFGARNILPKAQKQPAAEAASRVVAATTRKNGALAQAEFDAVKHLDQTATQALGAKALPPVKPRAQPNPRVPYLSKDALAGDLRRVQFPRDADGNRRRPMSADRETRALIEQKIALTGLFDRKQGPEIAHQPARKPTADTGSASNSPLENHPVDQQRGDPAAASSGRLAPTLARALDALTRRISFTHGVKPSAAPPAATASATPVAERAASARPKAGDAALPTIEAGPAARRSLGAAIRDALGSRAFSSKGDQPLSRENATHKDVGANSRTGDRETRFLRAGAEASARGIQVAQADSATRFDTPVRADPEPRRPEAAPIEVNPEKTALWRQMGGEAFEKHRLDWFEPYEASSTPMIDAFLGSPEFAQRVAQRLKALEPMRQRYRWEAETGRETAENLVELNIESPQLRQRLRAYLAAQREGAAAPSAFTAQRDPQGLTSRSLGEQDWTLFAVRSVVEDTAKVFSQEALFARDAARLDGAYEAGKDAIHAVGRQVADGASLLRGLQGDRFQPGMPPPTIIDAMLRLPVLAEAKLTGADPSEIMARDAAARERLEAGVGDAIAAARAAWEDPETAASAAKAFGVETLDAALVELGRLAGGQADRTAREAGLHRRLTAGEIDQAAFLDARRGLAREATLDFVTIASIVVPAGRGVAGALAKVDLPRGPGGGLAPVHVGGGAARVATDEFDPGRIIAVEARARDGSRWEPRNGPRVQEMRLREPDADFDVRFNRVYGAPPKDGSSLDAWLNEVDGDDILRRIDGDPSLERRIEWRLRRPGGKHEWLNVASFSDLRKLGYQVEVINSLDFTTSNSGRYFRIPGESIDPGISSAERRRIMVQQYSHNDHEFRRFSYQMHDAQASAIVNARNYFDGLIGMNVDERTAQMLARRYLEAHIGDIARKWLAPDAPWLRALPERR